MAHFRGCASYFNFHALNGGGTWTQTNRVFFMGFASRHSEAVLDRWARKFQVSARNAFSLISYVGEDCAGAVQFVQPERLEACISGESKSVQWLDEKEVAERLRMLRADHSAWRTPQDTGQFSLAGAQPKTALLFEDGKWGVPSGRMRTCPSCTAYDIASALSYDDLYFPELKLAMRIGRKYRLPEISGANWQRLAKATGQDAEELLTRIVNFCTTNAGPSCAGAQKHSETRN